MQAAGFQNFEKKNLGQCLFKYAPYIEIFYRDYDKHL